MDPWNHQCRGDLLLLVYMERPVWQVQTKLHVDVTYETADDAYDAQCEPASDSDTHFTCPQGHKKCPQLNGVLADEEISGVSKSSYSL